MEEFTDVSEREEPADVNSAASDILAWDLICAVEEFWQRHRFFPSVAEIRKLAPNISEEEVLETLETKRFQQRLENRGIDPTATHSPNKGEVKPNDTRLSDKQLAVAMCLLNIADTRSLPAKLRSLGVSPATYNGWMKSLKFAEFMQAQMEEMFGSSLPLVHKALMDKAVSGDFKSIKLIYEMTGRWRGVESSNNDNVKLVMMRLIEIIQKYVHDPTVLQLIAADMKSLSPEAFGGVPSNGSNHQIRAELT